MSGELSPAMLNQKIEGHEKLCAERYQGIHDKMGDLKKLLWGLMGVLVSMFVATLGWSLQQQYAANDANNRALQAQIAMLQGRMITPNGLPVQQGSAPQTVSTP